MKTVHTYCHILGRAQARSPSGEDTSTPAPMPAYMYPNTCKRKDHALARFRVKGGKR